MHVVGDFLNPNAETDEEVGSFHDAYLRMVERGEEIENLVVGLWEKGNDYASHVSINGETFKAV